MMSWIEAALLCVICFFSGNWMGDVKTMADCAMAQKAELMGAGWIVCKPAAQKQEGGDK